MTRRYRLGYLVLTFLIVESFTVAQGDDALDRLKSFIDGEKRAAADEQKFRFLNEALKHDQALREQAAKEADNVAQRMQRLRLLVESKKWALKGFRGNGAHLIPTSSQVPALLQTWEPTRNDYKQKFDFYLKGAKSDVYSGRALNYLLDACGAMAIEHQIYMEQANAQRAIENEKLIGTLPESTDTEAAVRLRAALIETLTGPKVLRRSDLQKVLVQRGGSNPKLTIRLDDEPLPLEWPYLIRTDKQYDRYTKAIESSKKAAIDELSAKKEKDSRGGISVDIQVRLMNETDALCQVFETSFLSYFASLKSRDNPEGKAVDMHIAMEMLRTRRYLKDLRGGITRFIEARTAEDAGVHELPGGDKLTVAELLAFMCRHNMMFSQCDINGQPAYETLYRQMSRYYVDLCALQLAMEADESKLNLDERQLDSLMQIQFTAFSDPTAPSANELATRVAEAFFGAFGRRSWSK
jgi:hypothetical protein